VRWRWQITQFVLKRTREAFNREVFTQTVWKRGNMTYGERIRGVKKRRDGIYVEKILPTDRSKWKGLLPGGVHKVDPPPSGSWTAHTSTGRLENGMRTKDSFQFYVTGRLAHSDEDAPGRSDVISWL